MSLRSIPIVFLAALIAGPGWASGKKPAASSKDSKPGLEAQANTLLDHVGSGVRQAAHKAKEGANKILQSIDDSIHKAAK